MPLSKYDDKKIYLIEIIRDKILFNDDFYNMMSDKNK